MSFWKILLRKLGFKPGKRTFHFDQATIQSLDSLAEREQRPKDEVAAELITYALAQRQMGEQYMQLWRSLSPREKEVAALICMDYTNQEIANRLAISPETVKTHVRNTLAKFGLRRKNDLRRALSSWDFSGWER